MGTEPNVGDNAGCDERMHRPGRGATRVVNGAIFSGETSKGAQCKEVEGQVTVVERRYWICWPNLCHQGNKRGGKVKEVEGQVTVVNGAGKHVITVVKI